MNEPMTVEDPVINEEVPNEVREEQVVEQPSCTNDNATTTRSRSGRVIRKPLQYR